MPKDRVILISILIITICVSVFFILSQNEDPILPGTKTSELLNMKKNYQAIIKEAKTYILSDEQKSRYEDEIESIKTTFFPKDSSSSGFGADIEKLIKQNGLRIKRVNDIANGFQFITEGSLYRSLSFLKSLETYDYQISVPVCNLRKTHENTWQLAVQCFPVYAGEIKNKEGDI